MHNFQTLEQTPYTKHEATRKAIGIFTQEELQQIQNSVIAIMALGGANGPVVDIIGRLCPKEIILVDVDHQVETKNLVQQSYSIDEVGLPKAFAKMKQLRNISPETNIPTYISDLSIQSNVDKILQQHKPNLIIEGVDNVMARMSIGRSAFEHKTPMLSGGNIGNSYFIKYFDNVKSHFGQNWQYLNHIYPDQIRWQDEFPDLNDSKTLEILQKEWIIYGLAIGNFTASGVRQVLNNPMDWPYVSYTGYQVAAHKTALALKLLTQKPIAEEFTNGNYIFDFDSNSTKSQEKLSSRMQGLRNVWGNINEIVKYLHS
jgi:molybdopterin/thiamine biosynthesis adenylyltransferase